MKSITLLHKENPREVEAVASSSSFFPRIIREFDDSDEPMIYGERN